MNTSYDTSNIVSYLQECLFSYDEVPFGEVDSLVLSWLSYIHFHEEFAINFSADGISPSELLKAEHYKEMFATLEGLESKSESMLLWSLFAASPRFRDIRIKFYRYELNPDSNLQFAAVVFSLRDDLHYVAFRGTDGTITGWREDFLLALLHSTGAQRMAEEYLNEVGDALNGRLLVGGHSKGGNLAVYASAHCKEKVQERIVKIYSHDGPGFRKEELAYPGYGRIHDRIRKTIPGTSYFGCLFENETTPRIIESVGVGVMQHNALGWRVKEGAFVKCRRQMESTAVAGLTERLNKVVGRFNDDEIALFIRTVFEVMDETGARTLEELLGNKAKTMAAITKVVVTQDPKLRKFMFNTAVMIFFGGNRDIGEIDAAAEVADGKTFEELYGELTPDDDDAYDQFIPQKTE